jgi:hypothetical protein
MHYYISDCPYYVPVSLFETIIYINLNYMIINFFKINISSKIHPSIKKNKI